MAEQSLIEEIAAALKERGLTLATVESATGGLIAQRITGLPGSSEFFRGAVVSYSNEVKTGVVGVSAEAIYEYGAVSPQVAEAMATGGRKLLGADICISDTGIAGPGGATESKPVGLFYLGLASPDGVDNRRHVFSGDRQTNRQQAADTALLWLREYLLGEAKD
jgi:nicotinamide-nucleotide amidase